jgi:hypothetical protein
MEEDPHTSGVVGDFLCIVATSHVEISLKYVFGKIFLLLNAANVI